MVNKFEVGSRILGVSPNISALSNKCWSDRKTAALRKLSLRNVMLLYL